MSATTFNYELHQELTGHLDWLRELARHLVRDENEALDLVQDTLLAALDKPPSLDRSLGPWLASVLRRLHFEGRRKRGRRAAREERTAKPESLPGSDEIVARLELAEQLISMVRGLPEPFRTTIALRYRDGLEPKEIAARLQIPGGTVRWRIKEGLHRLRTRLDQERGSRGAWVALLLPLSRNELPVPTESITLATPAVVGLSLAVVLSVAVIVTIWNGSSTTERVANADVVSIEKLEAFPGNAELRGDRSYSVARPNQRKLLVSEQTTDNRKLETERAPDPSPEPTELNGRIAGHVIDRNGLPAPGIDVAAYSSEPYPLASDSPGVGGRMPLGTTVTNEFGEYELQGLPSVPIQVRASSPCGRAIISQPLRAGSQPTPRAGEGLVLQLSSTSRTFDLQREADEEQSIATVGVELRGLVSRSSRTGRSSTISNLQVRLRRAYSDSEVAIKAGFRVIWRDPVDLLAITDSEGRFVMRAQGLDPRSRWGIEFLDTDGTSLGLFPVRLDRAEVDKEFALRPSSNLRLKLVLDPLESVQPGYVAISNGDGVVRQCALDAGTLATGFGEVQFDGLVAGAYEVRWFEGTPAAENGAIVSAIVFLDTQAGPRPVDVQIAPGFEHELRLDRRSLPSIRGRVLVDGEPASLWQVQLTPPRSSNGTPDTFILSVPLDDLGGFVIRTPRTGLFDARIAGVGVDGPCFYQRFEVDEVGADLLLDLRTCTVSGVWNGPALARKLWLRTPLSSGGVWIAPAVISANGALRIERAAPGSGELVFADHPSEARSEPAIAQIFVPQSGRTDISVP